MRRRTCAAYKTDHSLSSRPRSLRGILRGAAKGHGCPARLPRGSSLYRRKVIGPAAFARATAEILNFARGSAPLADDRFVRGASHYVGRADSAIKDGRSSGLQECCGKGNLN